MLSSFSSAAGCGLKTPRYFYIYFLINDYLYWLRPRLEQGGLPVPPAGRRLRTKLLAVFLIVAVTPTILGILDLTYFREIRAAQGLSLSQQIFFDLMASAFLVAVSFIFVSRSLLRPVNILMAAMAKLGEGDLDSRAPITSDDELGVLTERFNTMTDGLRERAYIRETFGRYVPESVASALVAGRGALEPTLVEATILFTDIAGFTRMAEGAPPARVVCMLNEYFAAVTAPIAQYGGVINQFQGDAMLVTFNVPVADPLHADHALLAALGIRRATHGRLFAGFSIETRAGINTGEVIAGPVGSADRLNYTVHGDAVNLAARLEQLNKKLATHILISQATMDRIEGHYRARSMGTVALRGKRQRVPIYSVDEGDDWLAPRSSPNAQSPRRMTP